MAMPICSVGCLYLKHKNHVRTCVECQEHQKSPAAASLHPWEWQAHPWQRLNIRQRRSIFRKYVPCGGGRTFQMAWDRDGIFSNIRPYHCQAQVHVCYAWPPTAHCVWQWGSFHQRWILGVPGTEWNTPCEVSTLPFGIKWVGWTVRTNIQDLAEVTRAQARQKAGHDKMSQDRQFTLGDSVFVWNFAAGPTWVAGSITAECGPRSFDVELGDGRVGKRHIDHVRSWAVAPPGDNSASVDTEDIPLPSTSAPTEPVDPQWPHRWDQLVLVDLQTVTLWNRTCSLLKRKECSNLCM